MTSRPLARLLLFTAFALIGATAAFAAAVDDDLAGRVARNWVRAVEHGLGTWGGRTTPMVHEREPLQRDGRLLGYLFRVAPRGYVLVPPSRELSPITAYSETAHMTGREPEGIFDFLGDALADRLDALESGLGVGEHPAWDRLGLPEDEFESLLAAKDEDWEGAGPLVTSQWHQGWPYNTLCPVGSGDARTFVGCTGLALAQILRHHNWPMRGYGNVSYWWDGDADCGSGSPGEDVEVNFMVPHDWQQMPDVVDWLSSPEEQYAVSELCYHVAAALWTDFSTCGSEASLSRASATLVNHFNYRYGAREHLRFRYPDSVWFAMIRGEIDAGAPTLYASTIHTMICDGWREGEGLQHVHINYGWAGDSDGWYALDSIETSLNPYAERMVTGIRPNDTVQTLVPEFEVERDGRDAKLKWELDTLDPTTGFHVWCGLAPGEMEPITTTALTGATDYEWYDTAAPRGDCYYKLEMIPPGGGLSIWIGPEACPSAVVIDDQIVPMLGPNPFNPMTEIRFDLPREAPVRAEIFDLAGRRLRTLVDGMLPPGPQRTVWDGRDAAGRHAPSGHYLLRLTVDGTPSVAKLILAR